MIGLVKRTIELLMTIGRLLSCWADKVELYDYSPISTSLSCPNKLIHAVDNITITFKVDLLGLTQLDTALFEVLLVRNKDVSTEFAKTLHKWKGYPPYQFEVKGPCSHAPTDGTHFFLKCNLRAHCEIAQTFVLLSLHHLGQLYKSLHAEIPKVYSMCANDDGQRQDFTVKIDDKDVARRPNCDMTLAAGPYHLLELCPLTLHHQMLMEIRRDGELLLQSRTGCAVVNNSFKVTPEEFTFSTHDTCGVRGWLTCRLGIAESRGRSPTVIFSAILVLTALALIILSAGLWINYKLRDTGNGVLSKKIEEQHEVEHNEKEYREEPKTYEVETSVDDMYTLANDRKRSRGSHGLPEVDTLIIKNSIDTSIKHSTDVVEITSKRPSNFGAVTPKRPSYVSAITSKRPSNFGAITTKRPSNVGATTTKRPSNFSEATSKTRSMSTDVSDTTTHEAIDSFLHGGTFEGTSELTPISVRKLPVTIVPPGTAKKESSAFKFLF